jgi:hypothetical protein
MSSTTSPGLVLIGSQEPRVLSAPSTATSAGAEAVALAELAGLSLFPWEQLVCDVALRQHATGRYAVLEVLLLVSRQNGKGTCIEAIELYALFIVGANVYHTAHLMSTSRKAFKRLWRLIERTPSLRRRVYGKPHKTADQITITLTNGAFITFMARSGRAGRGFDDADLLVLDEGLFLGPGMVEATLPAMSTRAAFTSTGPLVLYASSAGVEGSVLLRALRDRVHAGDPMISGLDWSIDPEAAAAPGFDPLALEVVAQANPSLGEGDGALITMEYVRGEFAAMTSTGSRNGYLRERLGVFDADPGEAAKVIPAAAWRTREDPDRERPAGPVGFAVAASWPDARWGSIGVAGWLDDELVVQLIDRRPGIGWVVERVRELTEDWDNVGVAIDAGGPAGALVEDLQEDADNHPRFELIVPTIRDIAHASSRFRTAVVGAPADEFGDGDAPFLRHHGQDEVDRAVRAATRRPLGNAWTFGIRDPEVDIGPLEVVTLAAWLAETRRPVVVPSPVGIGAGTGAAIAAKSDVRRMGF